MISSSAQRIMIWSALVMATIFGLSYGLLMHLLPLPPATLTAAQVAAFYAHNSLSIRLGAMLCSYTGGFMVPLAVVIAAQLSRLEKGLPIWSILAVAGGSMMSLFLVLPAILWGVAAYSPGRPAEVTLLAHEQANIFLVTTNQYWIFLFVAISYISLTQRVDARSPFPRWFGYVTIFIAVLFEAGAVCFLTRTGPFAWNGLFAYWVPLITFGVWLVLIATLLLKAIGRQSVDGG